MISGLNEKELDIANQIADLLLEKEKLQQENKQLKNILTELEEYIKKHIEEWENDEDEYLNGVVAEDKDILQLIQELKEKYNLLGDKE